jgi:dienelactone hydrolase
LEIAYFQEPGLPQHLENIHLEYFQHALTRLAAQPQVDPKRIVSFGISRGGELSLILASTFPRLIHAAVGYVPSSDALPSPGVSTEPAWRYRGKPIYGPIPVEKSSGPLFVAGGDDDLLWPSGLSVQLIADRMHAHGRHDVIALDYRNAGHDLGWVVPQPTLPAAARYGLVQSQYGPLNLGGSPKGDENARENSWLKLLRWLTAIN